MTESKRYTEKQRRRVLDIFGLCGDHDSALVFNPSANEQHRVAISWFHYTGPHMLYKTALFLLLLLLL